MGAVMNKPIILQLSEKIALLLAVIMIFPVLLGFMAANYDLAGGQFEIRRFRSARHVREITSAFQFELNQGENLYVAGFSRGGGQVPVRIRVIVENVESVQSFLSRFRGNVEEIALSSHNMNDGFYLPGTFRVFNTDTFSGDRDFYSRLAFFYDEDRLNAEFYVTNRGYPPQLREVYRILKSYYPIWLHPYFLVPAAFQFALVAFVIVRVVRRNVFDLGLHDMEYL
jgi:hypothetical protein